MVTVLYNLIIVFVAIIIMVVLGVFFLRTVQMIKRRNYQRFRSFITGIVIHYLFTSKKPLSGIKCLTRYRVQKRLFIQELMRLNNSFKGYINQNVRNFYRSLSLHEESLEKLKSHEPYTVISGMQELSSMQCVEYQEEILKLVKSTNQVVRTQAHIAYMKLCKDPLYFLNMEPYSLTAWEEMNVIDYLQRNSNADISSLENWLRSDSPDKVVFCLKIIAALGRYEELDVIHQLLWSNNLKVVSEALRTIGRLKSFESTGPLVRRLKVSKNERITGLCLLVLARVSVASTAIQCASIYLNSENQYVRNISSRIILELAKKDAAVDLDNQDDDHYIMAS